MKSLRKWLDARLARLNCFVNGHGPLDVLHVYEAKSMMKNFVDVGRGKIRAMPPHEAVYEHQKIRCARCGRISLAWTLIGAMTHTNTEPDAWQ